MNKICSKGSSRRDKADPSCKKCGGTGELSEMDTKPYAGFREHLYFGPFYCSCTRRNKDGE